MLLKLDKISVWLMQFGCSDIREGRLSESHNLIRASTNFCPDFIQLLSKLGRTWCNIYTYNRAQQKWVKIFLSVFLYFMRRNIFGDGWDENFANVSKNAQILVMLEPHLYPRIWIAEEIHEYLFRFLRCCFIVHESAFCKLSHIRSFPEMNIRY